MPTSLRRAAPLAARDHARPAATSAARHPPPSRRCATASASRHKSARPAFLIVRACPCLGAALRSAQGPCPRDQGGTERSRANLQQCGIQDTVASERMYSGEIYRDWFCCAAALPMDGGWGGTSIRIGTQMGPTTLPAHPDRPRGLQGRRAYRCRLGRFGNLPRLPRSTDRRSPRDGRRGRPAGGFPARRVSPRPPGKRGGCCHAQPGGESRDGHRRRLRRPRLGQRQGDRRAARAPGRRGVRASTSSPRPSPKPGASSRARAAPASPHRCDMLVADEVAAAMGACRDRFGRIDILVNNVGGSHPGGPVDMPEEVWDRQIDFNLKTAFLGCKHALPDHGGGQGGGAIVNISSIAGLRMGAARVHSAYSASKAGRDRLLQVGRHGLRGERHPLQHGGARPDAHAAGGAPPGAPARRQRRGGADRQAPRLRPDAAAWAAAGTSPTPCCSCSRTRRSTSPAPRSWWMAACPRRAPSERSGTPVPSCQAGRRSSEKQSMKRPSPAQSTGCWRSTRSPSFSA